MTYVATPIAVAVRAGCFTMSSFSGFSCIAGERNTFRRIFRSFCYFNLPKGLCGIRLVWLLVPLPVHLGAWPGGSWVPWWAPPWRFCCLVVVF